MRTNLAAEAMYVDATSFIPLRTQQMITFIPIERHNNLNNQQNVDSRAMRTASLNGMFHIQQNQLQQVDTSLGASLSFLKTPS
jgi:hypothetical protein